MQVVGLIVALVVSCIAIGSNSSPSVAQQVNSVLSALDKQVQEAAAE